MSAHEALGEQFTLYRGEGSHSRPSYYPTTGPNAQAGKWYTSDPDKAHRYAASTTEGKVYAVDVHKSEAEPRGLPGYFLIHDPEVRARRRLHVPEAES